MAESDTLTNHPGSITTLAARELAKASESQGRYCVVRGMVVAAPGNNSNAPGNFTIQDSSGAALLVRTQKVLPLAVWENVEVKGTLAWNVIESKDNRSKDIGFASITSEDITPLGMGAQFSGALITRSEALRGVRPVELVRVRGKVMREMIGESGPGTGEAVDYIVIGPEPELWAVLTRPRTQPSWISERVVPGTEVELSGILTFSNSAKEFRIRLRTPADIAIIHPTSWFTATRLLVLAIVLIVVVGSFFAWIWLLKRTIRRRTAEIREREHQLQQAQKMEVLNQLAGGIAHDFNNILMAMTGYAEILLEENIDESQKKTLREILNAGQRGSRLTRQLLTFSRKQPVTPALIDMNELVSELQPMLNRLVGKDIQISLNLGTGRPVVKADRSQLEQVLINLAANSRDAMPTGGDFSISTSIVSIASRTSALSPGAYVKLVISDTGYGMDPRTLSRVFDPFFTTKEVGKGTGLGLSTVHGIVRQNEGDVKVESTIGRGTTFTIYLPLKEGIPERRHSEKPFVAQEKYSGSILFVEDEDQIRDSITNFLRKLGFDVTAVGDGSDAMRLATRQRFDILLTDVVMPGISGIELFEVLSSSHPSLKVVFISGHAERAIDYGATKLRGPLLKKPFQLNELAEAIRRVLNLGKSKVIGSEMDGTRVSPSERLT